MEQANALYSFVEGRYSRKVLIFLFHVPFALFILSTYWVLLIYIYIYIFLSNSSGSECAAFLAKTLFKTDIAPS